MCQLSIAMKEILELQNLLETLTNEYQIEFQQNDPKTILADKRILIANKCAEAAHCCLQQSFAKFFRIHALKFAHHGVLMNPTNSDCFDILINLFQLEREEADENLKKFEAKFGQNSTENKETDLTTLVDRDIDAISVTNAGEIFLDHL